MTDPEQEIDEAEVEELAEQAELVRAMFGKMLTQACTELAAKLEGDDTISVRAFALGIEWGTMTFAACSARFLDESEESFLMLARAILNEDAPEDFSMTGLRQPKAH